jgi:hypothetical protein
MTQHGLIRLDEIFQGVVLKEEEEEERPARF